MQELYIALQKHLFQQCQLHLGFHQLHDMINFLGIKTVDLMTNNPKKIKALEAMGIVVNQRVPLYSSTNKYNEKYISTKVKKLGHLI